MMPLAPCRLMMKTFICLIFSLSSLGFAEEVSLYQQLKPIIDTILEKVHTKHTNPHTPPIIVSIAGSAGIGKTTLCNQLKKELLNHNIHACLISLDHYGKTPEERKELIHELDPRRLNWDLLHQTLQDIKNNIPFITKPTVNQLTKERGLEILDIANTDVVLFEGLYVLNTTPPMDYKHYADLSIYMETPLENIIDWKWEREFKKLVSRNEPAFLEHMQLILEDFMLRVYPTRRTADYLVFVDHAHHLTVADPTVLQERALPNLDSIRQSISDRLNISNRLIITY